MDLIRKKNEPLSCCDTEHNMTKAADYTDLFIDLKKSSKSNIRKKLPV